MKSLNYKNKLLEIDNNQFQLDYIIKEARIINGLAIVIFKYNQEIKIKGQFHNCVAFDENGKQVWVAQHPLNEASDCYVKFMNDNNDLWNFAGLVCKLDFKTGEIIYSEFTK